MVFIERWPFYNRTDCFIVDMSIFIAEMKTIILFPSGKHDMLGLPISVHNQWEMCTTGKEFIAKKLTLYNAEKIHEGLV